LTSWLAGISGTPAVVDYNGVLSLFYEGTGEMEYYPVAHTI